MLVRAAEVGGTPRIRVRLSSDLPYRTLWLEGSHASVGTVETAPRLLHLDLRTILVPKRHYTLMSYLHLDLRVLF